MEESIQRLATGELYQLSSRKRAPVGSGLWFSGQILARRNTLETSRVICLVLSSTASVEKNKCHTKGTKNMERGTWQAGMRTKVKLQRVCAECQDRYYYAGDIAGQVQRADILSFLLSDLSAVTFKD